MPPGPHLGGGGGGSEQTKDREGEDFKGGGEPMVNVPGNNALALTSNRGFEAAGLGPGEEAGVVDVPQVDGHQPEGHSRVLDRCELQAHAVVDVDQRRGHIPGQDVAPTHHVVWILRQACMVHATRVRRIHAISLIGRQGIELSSSLDSPAWFSSCKCGTHIRRGSKLALEELRNRESAPLKLPKLSTDALYCTQCMHACIPQGEEVAGKRHGAGLWAETTQ